MMSTRTFLLGTLAMNQTRFFEAVGDQLQKHGHRVAHLCFHERSHDYLKRRGKWSFNAFREAPGEDDRIDLSRYPWPSLNLVLSHEKAAYEVYDSASLVRKLRRYLAASEFALDQLQRDARTPVTLVQELGGFLANVASFYAARRRGLDNIFIEPSFFRGRVFFVRNTFCSRTVDGPSSSVVSEAVAGYLDDTMARQQAIIPAKDTHHYRAPIRKLTDRKNIRRLAEKTIDKYLLGKSEEFGHIGGHVARHARMFVNSRLLSGRYSKLAPCGRRFIYYPLHVPADVALTIRSPQFVDQYSLIDFIARAVPGTHEVLIKEHPALVGAVDRRRILEVLRMRDNVRLLHPGIDNYDVLKSADAVVTVNSKSGAEALLLGRPVIVLGDAFYSSCRLVRRVESLSRLPEALSGVLSAPPDLDDDSVRRYFQDVWNASWPGELHTSGVENEHVFARSVLMYLKQEAVDEQTHRST